MENPTNLLACRKVGILTPTLQIILIALLYVAMTIIAFGEYKSKGTMFGYPLSISILFVPIYEEIIFRGLILGEAEKHLSRSKAISLVSVLFALWHLKNIFWLPPMRLAYQMLYAGLIVSPILSYITLKTRTVWPAVILHYLNNLAAPFSWIVLALILHG